MVDILEQPIRMLQNERSLILCKIIFIGPNPDVGTKGRLISFLQNMAKKKQQQLLVTNNVFDEAKKSRRNLGYFSKNICDQ